MGELKWKEVIIYSGLILPSTEQKYMPEIMARRHLKFGLKIKARVPGSGTL